MTEPPPTGLGVLHEHGSSVRVTVDGRELTRYVYRPWDAQHESPRPYFHPVRTIGGDLVSLYRPHDHVWHKGISWSLPNVGTENFWGGATYRRGVGYADYDNNGSMNHDGFEHLAIEQDALRIVERLRWHTQAGEVWFTERRRFSVDLRPEYDAWILGFETAMTNVRGSRIVIGSPTTEGRDNAGYGGLFWRGPRSFTGGKLHAPGVTGGDELMGTSAPWLGFTGRHDGHGRTSTLAFIDASSNDEQHTRWFARSTPFACAGPAPFFSKEIPVDDGDTLTRRYAIVIADGDCQLAGIEKLAAIGVETLARLEDDGSRSSSGGA